MARTDYHHGDLRAALVRAAFALARRDGPDGVTLRRVAARAGVSEAAPYHHFADKRTLLGAAAGVGFEALDKRVVEAVAGLDPAGSLAAFAATYVAYAVDEPGAFRLMFGAHVAELDLAAIPETAIPGRRLKARTRAMAHECTAAHAETLFQMAWAQSQGMAWLVVEKELHPEGRGAASAQLACEVARDAVRRLVESFAESGCADRST